MRVDLVHERSHSLDDLWGQASGQASRGSRELWHAIIGESGAKAALDDLIARGAIWVALDPEIIAFAVVRNRIIEVIFVEESRRREGVATRMLETLGAMENPPIDAWALPGDRATKSLYESVGWKARLLTMRGE